MNFEDVLPVLLVVIPAAIGLFTYAWQERDKSQAALAARKQELYESLIGSLVDLLAAGTRSERSDLMTEIEKGWLFAPDEVLHAYYDYLAVYDELCCTTMKGGAFRSETVLARLRSEPEKRRELAELLAAVFVAMRRDIGGRTTRITDEWAKEHFDLYLWGVLAEDERKPEAATV